MNRLVVTLGALLLAAPLFSQIPAAAEPRIEKGALQWFLLTETRTEVRSKLGPPRIVAEFGEDFESWQYQIGEVEEEEFSHLLVFRKSSQTLISIAWNVFPARSVDELFPEAETTLHQYPDAKRPEFSVRLRKLPGERVLLAMGSSKPGQKVGQLLLTKESELRRLYPWINLSGDSARESRPQRDR